MTAQDRPGVIAAIARRLDDLGCGLVVASTDIVVGQVSVMVIASSGEGTLDTEQIRASLLGLDLELGSGYHVVPLPHRVPMWPQPGSGFYRLRFAVEEKAGAFHALTGPIADRDVPLWAFSTWVEDHRWCSGDVVTAPSPDVDVYALGEKLDKTLQQVGRRRSVSWRRMTRLPLPPVRQFVVPRKGIAVSVVGFARPGFVRGALETLADRNLSVIGSAMAILGAYTGLLMVVEGTDMTDVDELSTALRTRLRDHDRRIDEPFESQVDAWWIGTDPTPKWPFVATHTVRCEAADDPRLLVPVTEALARQSINIVRARTEVRPDGNGAETRVVDLAVAPPTGLDLDAVEQELGAMGSAAGWQLVQVREAEPDPDDIRMSRDPQPEGSPLPWLDRLSTLPPLHVSVDPTDDIREMRTADGD